MPSPYHGYNYSYLILTSYMGDYFVTTLPLQGSIWVVVWVLHAYCCLECSLDNEFCKQKYYTLTMGQATIFRKFCAPRTVRVKNTICCCAFSNILVSVSSSRFSLDILCTRYPGYDAHLVHVFPDLCSPYYCTWSFVFLFFLGRTNSLDKDRAKFLI